MNQISDQKEWLAIVNPNAGNGKGHKDWDLIAGFLKKENISVTCKIHRNQRACHHSDTGSRKGGFRNIITVGGDGTLNEVVNGIFT